MATHASKRVLFIGVGGLGCPAARVLATTDARLRFVDDDVVDVSNLHRQTLFRPEDVGRHKAELAVERLGGECVRGRFLPETAAELLEGVDVVIDGSDNLATKFLVCDAGHLHGVPVVQAGAVRWGGWSLASMPPDGVAHRTCLRCVFEDLPVGGAPGCSEVGVVGPVVGVLGAMEAALALRILAGEDPSGELTTYDGLAGRLRTSRVGPRDACPHARSSIRGLDRARYADACRSTL